MKWKIYRSGASLTSRVLGGVLMVMGLFIGTNTATPLWSAGFKSPEECLAYSGDAHLNCLYAYIEIQQDKISKLERKIWSQQETTQQLQARLAQQDLRTQVLERKIEGRLGSKSRGHQFSLRGSSMGFYYRFGSPFYYDPYFGPPFGYSYGMYYPWW